MFWQFVTYAGFALFGASAASGGKFKSDTRIYMYLASCLMVTAGLQFTFHHLPPY